jgi:hypothetical protein
MVAADGCVLVIARTPCVRSCSVDLRDAARFACRDPVVRLALALDPAHQLGPSDAERLGDSRDRRERRVGLAQLDPRERVGRKAGVVGEALLRAALPLALFA